MLRFTFYITVGYFLWATAVCRAQTGSISGIVMSDSLPVPFVNVVIQPLGSGTSTSANGSFSLTSIPYGKYTLHVSAIGYQSITDSVIVSDQHPSPFFSWNIMPSATELHEAVISGTMKEVSKLESPVNVEVYHARYFRANPVSSVFESMQNVNGVRPQLNCSVCNTGDIHMNGLEGPYTMVLIDGMPIVSGLSTVYGLTGIPQSLIDRVEIVKGPASTLYGSEAVGGLINIITKKPSQAPLFSVDVFGTTWGEVNADLGFRARIGKAYTLTGVNWFNYQLPVDYNKDGFTDVTLQNRISVFNKWEFIRKNNRAFILAGRFVYEDRWGGQMNWSPQFWGTDSVYGENIQTMRWEALGNYQLPFKENIRLQVSANGHYQHSAYGQVVYNATQYIGFAQLVWNHAWGKRNDVTVGLAYRWTYYDDNTPATAGFDTLGIPPNKPSQTHLPGIFVQDEIKIGERNILLLGLRFDYNTVHGSIFSPRINYKWSSRNGNNVFRVGVGNGYRVANVFTEDHAALTGAREVVFAEELQPETSWNVNINFVKKIYIRKGAVIGIDVTGWYTYFTNKIIPDYETNPNQIIYANLKGFSQSAGGSVNMDITWKALRVMAGITAMDVSIYEMGNWRRQLLTEQFTGVWNIGYTINNWDLSFDYTGNVYGPMRLPLLGPLDERAPFSPWFSIQNIQVTKKFSFGLEIYGGVKNFLNYTPPANSIARSFDPFDKEVVFGTNGQVVPTANNPQALTFDPNYVFAPNQGIRGFLGVRYTLPKKRMK